MDFENQSKLHINQEEKYIISMYLIYKYIIRKYIII